MVISVYVDRNVVDYNLTLFDRAVYPTSDLRVTRINLNPLRLRMSSSPQYRMRSIFRNIEKSYSFGIETNLSVCAIKQHEFESDAAMVCSYL